MKIQAWAVAAFLAGLSCAHAQTVPDKFRSAGKIVIGTVANYPPVTFKDPATNTLSGYDIDVGNAIGERLGVKVEWQETSFEQMISAVTTERIDLILAGMNDLPERRELIDFVDYMQSGVQYFVQQKRADEFKSAADLCGKIVGASRRTNFPKEIESWSQENCVKAGKPAIKVLGTEGSADARAQLRQGRIDAGAQGNETLPYLMSLEANTYKLLGEPYAMTYQGIGVSKKNPGLRDAVAAALQAMIADGSYQKIVDKYGVQPSTVKRIAINGKPLD
ncbi:ABC transporter substrate-binding protein [Bosea sp. LC85]|uniref:ABC transporter substrate-binding protein n=1 Tax=Bosea sp. LC85 TaxID=1502851 RepID=UPI0004E3D448|nr:ABC transporter substrate-binding protein [Bosea sp. LC85]KFC75987.1 ABC transporter substrate-binding protein [Bosea sp. LC85]